MFTVSYGLDVLAMQQDGYKDTYDLKPSLLLGPHDTAGGSSFSSSASSTSSRSHTESYDTPFETPLQHSATPWNAPIARGSDHPGHVPGVQPSPTPSTPSRSFQTVPSPSAMAQVSMSPADVRPLTLEHASHFAAPQPPPSMYYGAPQPHSADRLRFTQADQALLAPAFTAQLAEPTQVGSSDLSVTKDVNPPSAGPSASSFSAASSGSKQARHLACSFCRGRKLRCILDDEGQPCRQCQRRKLECHMPKPGDEEPNVPKAKKRKNSEAGKSLSTSPPRGSKKGSASSSPVKNQPVDSSVYLEDSTSGAATTVSAPHLRERQRSGQKLSLVLPGTNSNTTPPLSDVALFTAMGGARSPQNPYFVVGVPVGIETLPIGGDWWDRCLKLFGPRPRSVRIVETLLTQFVSKHATIMGIIHGPSFLENMRRPQTRATVHPALIYSALAAAVCDLDFTRAEPYNADIAAADANARRIANELRQIANDYLDASLISRNAARVPVAQAASFLALTETQTGEKRRLLSIVGSMVRSLDIPKEAFQPPGQREFYHPSHPSYFSLPTRQGSIDAEIHVEQMLRLCKAQVAHACRKVLAAPDEDVTDLDVPDFVMDLRAFNVWEPSNLPDPAPMTFFASAHFAGVASMMAKTLVRVARIKSTGVPADPAVHLSNPLVFKALVELEEIEGSIDLLRNQGVGFTEQIFPHQAVILVIKLHVLTRMSVWRKTGLWRLPEAGGATAGAVESSGVLLSSFDWWLELYGEMIADLDADSREHLSSGKKLHTSDAQVESALRHTRLATQMYKLLDYPYFGLKKQVHSALSAIQVHVELRPNSTSSSSSSGLPLSLFLEQVRSEVASLGPAADGLDAAAAHGCASHDGMMPAIPSNLWAQLEELDALDAQQRQRGHGL